MKNDSLHRPASTASVFSLLVCSVNRNIIKCNFRYTRICCLLKEVYNAPGVRCHPLTGEKFKADYNKYKPMYQYI